MNRENVNTREQNEKEIKKVVFVPGHGPNLEEKTDEEVELIANMIKTMRERGR